MGHARRRKGRDGKVRYTAYYDDLRGLLARTAPLTSVDSGAVPSGNPPARVASLVTLTVAPARRRHPLRVRAAAARAKQTARRAPSR